MIKNIILVLGLTLVGATAQTNVASVDVSATLLDIYNQFITQFSDENPAWKTDITLGTKLETKPTAPYKQHYNDLLGYYTYRPKTWEELNDYEKFAVQNDPRLPGFVKARAKELRQLKAVAQSPAPQPSPEPVPQPSPEPTVAKIPQPSPVVESVKPTPNPELTQLLLQTDTLLDQARNLKKQQQRGILNREGDFSFAYQFDPAELVTANPVRLVEVP